MVAGVPGAAGLGQVCQARPTTHPPGPPGHHGPLYPLATMAPCTSCTRRLRPVVKWFLRHTTRLCELQRVCYGETSGAPRTIAVGKGLLLSTFVIGVITLIS